MLSVPLVPRLRYHVAMLRVAHSIRTRVLAIVLIPSVALFVVGVGAAGYLVAEGMHAQSWSEEIDRATAGASRFSTSVEEERRLSLLALGGSQDSAALAVQRIQVDGAISASKDTGDSLTELDPAAMQESLAALGQILGQLPAMRQRVDTGGVSIEDTYAFYNDLVDIISIGMQGLASSAPDSTTGVEETTATDIFLAAEAMSRGNALAAAAIAHGGLSAAQLQEYGRQVGTYHGLLDALQLRLTTAERGRYTRLTESPAWQRLVTVEDAIIQRGAPVGAEQDATPLPLSFEDWQGAAAQVNTELVALWQEHLRYAQGLAADYGERTATNSMIGGAVVLLIAIVAFLIALRLSNLLIGRLERLRRDTLELAEKRLPELIDRIRVGEEVNLTSGVPALEHGRDEIGHVADAFNKAQQSAVNAAVTEARTREGVNAVFLNIAHRSQVVVHRILEILDNAEYKQEDPDVLELLFQLDHLATRERRNAENLIILGGEEPGRQWRNPVSLVDIVRSAVAETEHYTRVRTTRLPEVSIVGAVVADLIHLLAELVDNATSFSPPDSRVEVSGNQVGKGIVVVIEDQGLGIPAEELDRLNKTFRDTPDFGVMTLSGDSRLGLFVVARLASRTGITVRLTESDYGGIRAIALVPSALIADAPVGPESRQVTEPEILHDQAVALRRNRTVTPSSRDQETTAVIWPIAETGAEVPARHRADENVHSGLTVGRPSPTADRPPLPRRNRQTHLAPELAEPAPRPVGERDSDDGVAAEKTRDLLAAIQAGTNHARQAADLGTATPFNMFDDSGMN